MTDVQPDFTGLRALFINCTLKRSPEPSNTQGLIDISTHIMAKHGVEVEVVRAVDHDIATGVWPDMREHGWATDDWPVIFEKVLGSDILVLAGPIWLGDNSSVMKQVHERLYGGSLGSFVAALTAEKPLAQSEIDELRRYLDEMSGKAGE